MAIPLGLKVKSLFYALTHQWVYLDEHCTAFFFWRFLFVFGFAGYIFKF